jgi:potassium-transporting ATPase KdpC subunit
MKNLIISIKLFFLLTIITSILYPLVITLFANSVYPQKSNGSMIIKDKEIIGSELIGQQFSRPEYFWGRPSAINYNPMPSGGSNLNPVGSLIKEQIQTRIDTIKKYQGDATINEVPKDLLFASASGVDPHISPEAAYFQVDRVVEARKFGPEQKNKLIELIKKSIESPDLFIFGELRINVLVINLKLDNLQ